MVENTEKVGTRIKRLRVSKNLTLNELAQKIGYTSRSTIHFIENNRTTPKIEILEKIASALDTSVDFLLYGGTLENNTPKNYKIPVLGEVAAGVPIEAVEDVIDYEELPLSWKSKGEFFALQIKGDSMYPRIEDKDVVIVRKQPNADTNDIVIVVVNGDSATCKKLKKLSNGIMLISNNPSYEPMYYSNEDIEKLPVTIIGKVVELRAKL